MTIQYRVVLALLLAIGSSSVALSQQTTDSSGKKVVKLTPKMRVVERNRDFFKSIPCDQTQNVSPKNAEETKMLERRRKQCLNKYKAFLPVPVDQ